MTALEILDALTDMQWRLRGRHVRGNAILVAPDVYQDIQDAFDTKAWLPQGGFVLHELDLPYSRCYVFEGDTVPEGHIYMGPVAEILSMKEQGNERRQD